MPKPRWGNNIMLMHVEWEFIPSEVQNAMAALRRALHENTDWVHAQVTFDNIAEGELPTISAIVEKFPLTNQDGSESNG